MSDHELITPASNRFDNVYIAHNSIGSSSFKMLVNGQEIKGVVSYSVTGGVNQLTRVDVAFHAGSVVVDMVDSSIGGLCVD
jgi:hypothetical protein